MFLRCSFITFESRQQEIGIYSALSDIKNTSNISRSYKKVVYSKIYCITGHIIIAIVII